MTSLEVASPLVLARARVRIFSHNAPDTNPTERTGQLVVSSESLLKNAITAGRQAYLAGRMAKKVYASASSPLEGVVR